MSGLVAKTKLTFRVEPEEQGGATQTVRIDRRRITISVRPRFSCLGYQDDDALRPP